MASALEGLQELLGEPECWGWARPRLWEAAEGHLGTALPADYKAFLDLYGPGGFDGFLWIERPMDDTEEEFERVWPMSGRSDHRDDPDLYPFPFHPEPGGLILWGAEEDGHAFYYFLPDGPDPADWRIVIETDEAEWLEAPGPFTEFLLGLADNTYRPAHLHRYRPGPTVRYHQEPASAGL
ncbi:SMI1/KNR4 family protein [Streptomyces sp. NBC_01351]|uniref:SMI1/KNR4 family protein n=1 Tax=Streptomyces sp. NBC_01351 TaxID=2903833 RepID=UPI002E335C1C|nr:SMI1/KNR4 family protein [Streptomyces sp. NBC_01351]